MISGSDEMSQLKVHNHQRKRKRSEEDEEQMETDSESQPPPEKKCKCVKEQTKSLFSSQYCLMAVNAILPGQKPKLLWQNEHANSIYGHQPNR